MKKVRIKVDDVPSLKRFKKGDTGDLVSIDKVQRGSYDYEVKLHNSIYTIMFQKCELEYCDGT